MKKTITTLFLVVMGVCIMQSVNSVFADDNIIPNSVFTQGREESLQAWFCYIPMYAYGNNKLTYHDILSADFSNAFHELINVFNIGVMDEKTSADIVKQYNLEKNFQICKVYYLDEIQQTFNAVYNTNINMASLDKICLYDDMPLVRVIDNYFIVNQSPHGTTDEPIPVKGIRLSSGSEYWTWYFNNVADNSPNSNSNLIYTVISYKTVCGYSVRTIDYIGYVPPSDEFLAGYNVASDISNASSDSFFQSPDYLNPFGKFAVELVVGDYTYGVGTASNLVRYRNDGSDYSVLARDSVNFITDGKTLYYSPYEENAIYRMSADGTNYERIIDNIDANIVACWDNKYLYLAKNSYSGDKLYQSMWMYDLNSEKEQLLFEEAPEKTVAYGGKLYYLEYRKDIECYDLYLSELDGSAPRLLANKICNFKIIDGEIYYAKHDGGQKLDEAVFHMGKCSLNGENSVDISDRMYDAGCQVINKDYVTVRYSDYIEDVSYNYSEAVKVKVNKELLKLERLPITENGRVLVPMRAIFERLGFDVEWDGVKINVLNKNGVNVLSLWNGKNEMLINNSQHVALDVLPRIVDGRTFVPVRAVSESIGADVQWDADTRTVIITYDENKSCNHYYNSLYETGAIYAVDENVHAIEIGYYDMCEFCEDSYMLEGIDIDYSPHEFVDGICYCGYVLDFVPWKGTAYEPGKGENSRNKQILMNFLRNDFGKIEINVHNSMYSISSIGSDIDVDDEYFADYQIVKSSYFADIDYDGELELAVTSTPATKNGTYGKCLSLWDCDMDGNVYMITAVGGASGRTAHKYHIAICYGQIYLYETKGESNSVGESHYRCAYKYSQGNFVPELSAYSEYSYYNEDEFDSKINGRDCSREEAKEYFEGLEVNTNRLYTCE